MAKAYRLIVGISMLHWSLSDCVFGIFVILKVMDLIPSEKEGEPFEEAMARVRRCINGGGGQGLGVDDDGSDSDLEVVAESISVNLRCPVRTMLLWDMSLMLLSFCNNVFKF